MRARGGAGPHTNQNTQPSTTGNPPSNQHPITAHHINQRNPRFRLDFHTTSVVQTKTSAQNRLLQPAQAHRTIAASIRGACTLLLFDAATDNQILKSVCGRDNHRAAQSDLISRENGEIDCSKQPAAVPAKSLRGSGETQTKTRLRRSL